VVGGFSLVAAGLPEQEVYLPYELPKDAAFDLLVTLSSSLGLVVCELDSGVILLLAVSFSCGVDELSASPVDGVGGVGDAAGEVAAIPSDSEPTGGEATGGLAGGLRESRSRYAVRVYVVEVNDERATELGVDWRQLFDTANLLSANLSVMLAGYVGAAELDSVVSFFEREGLGRRLDDLTLFALAGEPVRFNRGGSINVSLVGGEQVVQSSYQVGLTASLTVTPHADGVELAYEIADTSPSNVSDPSNIQLSSTSNSSRVVMACGGSSLLVALNSERITGAGEGLPVAARIPVAGYAFGSGTDAYRRSSVVVSAEVECL
jgi:hypothetical protein